MIYDPTTLTRAAELLEVDATSLRECHNLDPLQPDWKDEEEAQETHDEALKIAEALRRTAGTIQRLAHHFTELGKAADRAALVLATIEAENTTESEMLQDIIDGISKWAPAAILGELSS